ncbi:MAG: AraC family transcriptional regulator [Candidatus Symbiothrix sp.]|jgi:AraC-like DNA-binding protein/quercetin dioxygenase-like cupin family protein|nr:AraC family transcriptional regulator [Candidatus Symbiothrix sp.]
MAKIADGFKGERVIFTPNSIQTYQSMNNQVTKQLFVTAIGYYPQAKFHFRERPEGMDENLIIYCEDGAGWIEYNEIRYNLTKNQAFILPANEAHAYGSSNTDPWSIYWIHFRGEAVSLFSSHIGCLIDLTDSTHNRYQDRFLLFEEIFQNLSMGYSPENLEYVSWCLGYFLASIKYLKQYRNVKNVKVTDCIQKSILFMKDNLENKITLEEIAKHANYSKSRFSTLFFQKTSFTPMVYYNQLKIQKACSYLQFSDFNLKEIAFRLGFYGPFHFSSVFKQEMGMTPKKYRKIHKEK